MSMQAHRAIFGVIFTAALALIVYSVVDMARKSGPCREKGGVLVSDGGLGRVCVPATTVQHVIIEER